MKNLTIDEIKYKEIYKSYKTNCESIFNSIQNNNNNINIFLNEYFYNFLSYFFTTQILSQNLKKILLDNNSLLNQNNILINLVEEILNLNFEVANNNALSSNAWNNLLKYNFINDENNFISPRNFINNNNANNNKNMRKRMSITITGDLNKMVKFVNKKSLNVVVKTVGGGLKKVNSLFISKQTTLHSVFLLFSGVSVPYGHFLHVSELYK